MDNSTGLEAHEGNWVWMAEGRRAGADKRIIRTDSNILPKLTEMTYLRVFLNLGQRVYQKVDANAFAEASRIAKRKTDRFERVEKITRRDFEVGLFEMDIE